MLTLNTQSTGDTPKVGQSIVTLTAGSTLCSTNSMHGPQEVICLVQGQCWPLDTMSSAAAALAAAADHIRAADVPWQGGAQGSHCLAPCQCRCLCTSCAACWCQFAAKILYESRSALLHLQHLPGAMQLAACLSLKPCQSAGGSLAKELSHGHLLALLLALPSQSIPDKTWCASLFEYPCWHLQSFALWPPCILWDLFALLLLGGEAETDATSLAHRSAHQTQKT